MPGPPTRRLPPVPTPVAPTNAGGRKLHQQVSSSLLELCWPTPCFAARLTCVDVPLQLVRFLSPCTLPSHCTQTRPLPLPVLQQQSCVTSIVDLARYRSLLNLCPSQHTRSHNVDTSNLARPGSPRVLLTTFLGNYIPTAAVSIRTCTIALLRAQVSLFCLSRPQRQSPRPPC